MPPQDERRGKPGFLATDVGSRLRMRLQLPALPLLAAASQLSATVYLGFLSSYENMGIASVGCDTGCTCGNVTLDGHRTGRKVSLEELSPPIVLRASSSSISAHTSALSNTDDAMKSTGANRSDASWWQCTLVAVVLPQTNSGLHKVKFTSLATVSGSLAHYGLDDPRSMLEGNFNALRRTEAAHDLNTEGHVAYAYAKPVI